MPDDIRWCSQCDGYTDAGGGGTCTCNEDDEGDMVDHLYEQERDRRIEEQMED